MIIEIFSVKSITSIPPEPFFFIVVPDKKQKSNNYETVPFFLIRTCGKSS